jgi:hypothetical protein
LRKLKPIGAYGYDLEALAGNPHFGRLRELYVRPTYGWIEPLPPDQTCAVVRTRHLPGLKCLRLDMFEKGDELCQVIADSGILARLEVLELCIAYITEHDARALARCADLKHLKRLDVTNNCLSPEGVAALRRTGIEVIAEDQAGPTTPERWRNYEVWLEIE